MSKKVADKAKKHYITGQLIDVDEGTLVLDQGHIGSGIWFHADKLTTYPHTLDEEVVDRFRGKRLRCRLVDGIIISFGLEGWPIIEGWEFPADREKHG